MAEDKEEKQTKIPVAADFASIEARIAVALAARERLVKSWTAKSTAPKPPPKTKEQLDAEKAEIYALSSRAKPSVRRTGVGNNVSRQALGGNDRLRGAMGVKNAHQGIKARDGDDAKMGKSRKRDESSDDEDGRYGLMKGRKAKLVKVERKAAVNPAALQVTDVNLERKVEDTSAHMTLSSDGNGQERVSKAQGLPIRPIRANDGTETVTEGKDSDDDVDVEALAMTKSDPNTSLLPDSERRRAKLREKKRKQKLLKKQRQKEAKAVLAG